MTKLQRTIVFNFHFLLFKIPNHKTSVAYKSNNSSKCCAMAWPPQRDWSPRMSFGNNVGFFCAMICMYSVNVRNVWKPFFKWQLKNSRERERERAKFCLEIRIDWVESSNPIGQCGPAHTYMTLRILFCALSHPFQSSMWRFKIGSVRDHSSVNPLAFDNSPT